MLQCFNGGHRDVTQGCSHQLSICRESSNSQPLAGVETAGAETEKKEGKEVNSNGL